MRVPYLINLNRSSRCLQPMARSFTPHDTMLTNALSSVSACPFVSSLSAWGGTYIAGLKGGVSSCLSYPHPIGCGGLNWAEERGRRPSEKDLSLSVELSRGSV